MKIKEIIAAFSFFAALLVALPAGASNIPEFYQRIRISGDGALGIEESVKVFFDSPRHGIYRDIPVKYRTEAGNPLTTAVKIISVADGKTGKEISYSTSRQGNYLRIKIGDADKTVVGEQNYSIEYEVSRALLFLEDEDQLYWNVSTEPWNDLGWPERARAEVELPPGVSLGAVRTRCFVGLGYGGPENCAKTDVGSTIEFSAENSPLTIVVGWPKGAVREPTRSERARLWLADNGIIFWPVAVFVAMYALWHKKGRDPKVKSSIVVQYAPPEGVSPAELGALVNSAVGKNEITATIVDLAVRGYLEIEEKEEKGVFGGGSGYSFRLVKPSDAGLKPHEAHVLDGIFGDAEAGEKKELSELQNEFYKSAEAAKGSVLLAAVGRGWFSRSPRSVRGAYVGMAAAYLAVVFFLAGALMSNGPTWMISLIIPAAIIAFFGYFMPARTLKGTDAFAHALGFKEYLSKAEKYRLKWEEKENIFEKYLPYAMIFGVVDKWAKAFEGILNEPPNWYHGAAYGNWTPLLFIHSLNAATESISNTIFTAPSAKGGGGFGGGGFGGGGFGGGGGGSW